MAQLGMVFNQGDHEPTGTRSVIPPGTYLAQIVSSTVKNTKSGSGQFLEMEVAIIDGQYQGLKVTERLNLWNSNAQAVEIANRTLSAICLAVGKASISDSDELHGRSFKVVLEVTAPRTVGDKTYGPSNEIKGYLAANAASPAPAYTAPAAPATQAPAAPAAGGAAPPPWKR